MWYVESVFGHNGSFHGVIKKSLTGGIFSNVFFHVFSLQARLPGT